MSGDPAAPKKVEPAVYDLFWCTDLPGGSGDGLQRMTLRRGVQTVVAALGLGNQVTRQPPFEAIVLYPAFLTPALCEEGGYLELLLLAPSDPALTPDLVNRHLKVSPGFDPGRWATTRVLVGDAAKAIRVEKTEPDDGILSTHTAFWGIVDARFDDNLKEWHGARAKVKATADRRELDTFYKVRFPVSCLATAVGPASVDVKPEAPQGAWRSDEPHDSLLQSVLLRMNGTGLGGQEGPGTPAKDGSGLHAFPVDAQTGKVDLSQHDPRQPIVAHHPVFVYPKDQLGYASFGHLSDLHVNSRQQVLARSPARVIEVAGGPDAGSVASPEIGDQVVVYSANVLSIMSALADQADVLLVGGDLVDHVKNVFPYTEHHPAGELEPVKGGETKPTAKQVWELVRLDGKKVDQNYQRFVDHLTFYSIARQVCDTKKRPAFVVTGNHDGYLEPFGISPRVLKQRANPGIPADHNLTFFEAMLAFGRSYAEVTTSASIWLKKELFGWFHGVFTPFRDYAVDLPKQRVVGLAWGDDEEKLWSPVSGQGILSHLPRANKSVGEQQVALVEKALEGGKQGILSTHFTFVSYGESIANVPDGKPIDGRDPQPGFVRVTGRFTDHDFGTFVGQRPKVYAKVHDGRFRLVFTGHSHRKGLYRITGPSQIGLGTYYPTAMYPLVEPFDQKALAAAGFKSGAAIVVSDSSGPLPRLNHHGEFANWGSDRPAGTLVTVKREDGALLGVQAVQASSPRTRPRLAVALDFLHVEEGQGIARINSSAWSWAEDFNAKRHHLRFTFHEKFAKRPVQLNSVDLHILLAKGQPWKVLSLGGGKASTAAEVVTFDVRMDDNPTYLNWLKAVKVPRFLSLHFASTGDSRAAQYDCGPGGIWRFPVKCEMPSSTNLMHYEIEPLNEEPDYDLREKYFPDKYAK